MARKQFNLHDGKKGAALAIRVTPRARRNEIVEVISDGTVPASRIEIVAGTTGRDKLVSILDLDADTVHHMILSHLI
jgi:uncharacterized protein YggU (UPF0235/DUF167 family)